MKISFIILFFILSTPLNSSATEIWKFYTKIKQVYTFGGGGSPYACIKSDSVDKWVCIDLRKEWAKETYSMLLAAQVSQQDISFSYKDDESITGLWFDNYLAGHFRIGPK